ncbi:glycosyl transferase, group 1 (plasmid) [Azospirillum baldaniorum]|uniref:Glycosyl transferase, group 1 n=1 Tax=Azospirillum baldaniorum TaxID=1064539 RepID=A0A9P1K202_9PROT|nr:glycosyltransferase family 4 protein [Azospirillum baldaniorum]AWJ93513.1 glycosyl transferase, group 1 [Azospirillum baldaniorum]TWA70283.1 glycosyltransferase involved in cell wall biosynthesis [Azospirillum brasilense]CCD04055.1 glycosyl transferase, group 1 [Azospirillum baldaniorum]
MRILLLSRYGLRGPSSRLRHYQFMPALERAGMSVETMPLLSDSYLEALYAGRPRPFRSVAQGYLDRVRRFCDTRSFDLLWIEKEVLPWLPYGGESALLNAAPPYVLDFDDAWFHRYDLSRWWPVRRLLGDKLDRLMRRAALVTVGNGYLAGRAESAGARHVEILPTVVDLDHYPVPSPTEPSRPMVVGWIGSPITEHYLDLIAGPLRDVMETEGVRISLVGASPAALGALRPDRYLWEEETESRRIAGFDVGVMPLSDTPWERGKCGYKLIQYMACGKPVVASPVGMNRDIVEHGVNGFLATTPEDWTMALGRLAADPDLRRRMGTAGRARVEALYSLDRMAPRLVDLLQAARRG